MASNLKSGSSVPSLPYYCIFDINYHPNIAHILYARGICISPYVGPYSYCEFNYCDRLHILITFIYIITPLPTSTHKPVLARAPSSVILREYMFRSTPVCVYPAILSRCGSVVDGYTSACHAAGRGSIPGPGALIMRLKTWLSRLCFYVYICVFRMRRHSGFSISSCSYLLYPPPSLQPQPCHLSPHP